MIEISIPIELINELEESFLLGPMNEDGTRQSNNVLSKKFLEEFDKASEATRFLKVLEHATSEFITIKEEKIEVSENSSNEFWSKIGAKNETI